MSQIPRAGTNPAPLTWSVVPGRPSVLRLRFDDGVAVPGDWVMVSPEVGMAVQGAIDGQDLTFTLSAAQVEGVVGRRYLIVDSSEVPRIGGAFSEWMGAGVPGVVRVTLSDGTIVTGFHGPEGPQGPPGTSILFGPPVATFADLENAYPAPHFGETHVATDDDHMYSWNGEEWVDAGALPAAQELAGATGAATYDAGTRIIDVPVDGPATSATARTLGNGPNQAAAGEAARFNVALYGAVGDGVTDDTAAIQDAIDAASAAGGGFVVGWKRHVITNITVPDHVTLFQPGSSGVGGFSGGTITEAAGTLMAAATTTGFMVTLDSGNTKTYNAGLIGMTIIGRGAVDADQSGVQIAQGAINCRIVDCVITKHPMYGVHLASESSVVSSGASYVTNNKIFGCYRGASQLGASERIASLRIDHTDCYVRDNEIGTPITSVDASLRRVALWATTRCGYGRLSGNVYEMADIGALVEGVGNQFTNDRADYNWGHGWFVGRGPGSTTGDPRDNMFVNCRALRNSRGTTNTYDGFHVDRSNGGICFTNNFVGCQSNPLTIDAWVQRYGYYSDGDPPATGTQTGNQFVACTGWGNGTALKGGPALNRVMWVTGRVGQVGLSGGGTPNVDDIEFVTLNDAAAAGALYTDFLNGTNGQMLYVIGANAGGSVLVHSTSLRLKGGVNKTLGAAELIALKKHPSYGWVQVQG